MLAIYQRYICKQITTTTNRYKEYDVSNHQRYICKQITTYDFDIPTGKMMLAIYQRYIL